MIYILLADGFEEIEAITVFDIIKRAEIPTKIVSIGDTTVCGCHGLRVLADATPPLVQDESLMGIVLPGGLLGTQNLSRSSLVKELVMHCSQNNLLIAAICAAPSILGRMNILNDKRATCYPGFEQELHKAKLCGDSVCCDGNIITANGPGAGVNFGLAIVEYFRNAQVARQIKADMQCI